MVGFLEPAALFGFDAPGEAGEGGVDGGGVGLGLDAEVDDFGGRGGGLEGRGRFGGLGGLGGEEGRGGEGKGEEG